MRRKLVEILKKPSAGQVKVTDEDRQWATEIGLRLEEELYELFRSQTKTYSDKARMLLFNLQDPKNPAFKRMLLDQMITPN